MALILLTSALSGRILVILTVLAKEVYMRRYQWRRQAPQHEYMYWSDTQGKEPNTFNEKTIYIADIHIYIRLESGVSGTSYHVNSLFQYVYSHNILLYSIANYIGLRDRCMINVST